MKETVCIIVDAYSTGKNLAPAFASHGYKCIHIKSSTQLPDKFKHKESDFIKCFTYQDNIENILKELEPYQVKLCVPGYESGVELADLLCERLGLAGNGSEYSKARRDKYIMTQTVAQAGLKTVQHIQSDNAEIINAWAKKLPESEVVVLKPLDSANGDGVYFCTNQQEINTAFHKIISSCNQFGQKNTQVLAQSLNAGQEYIVNTVSWSGQHYVAEIWKITRKLHSTIYDRAEYLRETDEDWQLIVDYTKKVLDALHIKFGAGTTELKYTPENGPILLETSARLMSGSPLSFSQKLSQFTQLSLMVEAYQDTDRFLQRFNDSRPVTDSYGLGVILISDCEGVLNEDLDSKKIEKLVSFHCCTINGEQGQTIQKTINSLTSPGEIYLISKSKKTLQEDYSSIRFFEATGLYRNALKKPDCEQSGIIQAKKSAPSFFQQLVPISKSPTYLPPIFNQPILPSQEHSNLRQS